MPVDIKNQKTLQKVYILLPIGLCQKDDPTLVSRYPSSQDNPVIKTGTYTHT